MTHAAQLAFYSKLDATAFPPNTIFIFTANSTDLLTKAFLSRCHLVNFGTEGIGKELAAFLARVRRAGTGKDNGIDFKRLADESEGNVRDALHRLEVELMADGIPEEAPAPPESHSRPDVIPAQAGIRGAGSSGNPPDSQEARKNAPEGSRNVRRCPAKGKPPDSIRLAL